MPLACALAVLLVAPATGPAAPAAGSVDEPEAVLPAASADDRAERVRQAGLLHAARRYAAAADAYEALYEETSDSALLLAAARSRMAAGHNAHAVAYFSALVASGRLTAADTQVVYGELQAAQRGVTPVTVRVQIPVALAADSPQLTAQYVPQYGADPRPPLEFPLPPGAGATRVVMLQLDPGAWRLKIAGPTLAEVDVLVDVLTVPGPAVRLDLRRPDLDGLPPPQRRRLAGVLAGAGGALLGVGVGLTARGQLAQVQPTLARPAADCPTALACQQDLAAAFTGRSVGAGLLGAGAGLLASGLTALAGDARRRRAAWIVELALGGAGVVGSSVAVALSARAFDHENVRADRPWGDPDRADAISRRGQHHTIAAAGLGLGSGLVFGSVIGLVRTRIHRRSARVHPSLGLGTRGLAVTLSGRF